MSFRAHSSVEDLKKRIPDNFVWIPTTVGERLQQFLQKTVVVCFRQSLCTQFTIGHISFPKPSLFWPAVLQEGRQSNIVIQAASITNSVGTPNLLVLDHTARMRSE